VSVGLVRQNKLGVALSCVARTCVATVHPVHEVTSTVPDGEDEHHAALKSFTHDFQTAKSLGLTRSGVAVILQNVKRHD
jgi:hypothetical protein